MKQQIYSKLYFHAKIKERLYTFIQYLKHTLLYFYVKVQLPAEIWNFAKLNWYPLFWTWDDSAAHEFQSQSGFTVTCALLLPAHNVPQSYVWLLELGIEPRSLTCEQCTVPLCLLSPARRITSIFMVYFATCFKMILIKIKGPNIPSILLLQMNFKKLF